MYQKTPSVQQAQDVQLRMCVCCSVFSERDSDDMNTDQAEPSSPAVHGARCVEPEDLEVPTPQWREQFIQVCKLLVFGIDLIKKIL